MTHPRPAPPPPPLPPATAPTYTPLLFLSPPFTPPLQLHLIPLPPFALCCVLSVLSVDSSSSCSLTLHLPVSMLAPECVCVCACVVLSHTEPDNRDVKR